MWFLIPFFLFLVTALGVALYVNHRPEPGDFVDQEDYEYPPEPARQ